jgi:hypothetical protein
MGPIAAQLNVYPCNVPSVRIPGDPIAPNGACETVSKKISGQMGGSGRSPSEFHEAKTPYLQVFCSALGRTRTCGLLIRSEPFRASFESHRVPFGPCLCAFCSVTMSLDPCESRRAPVHKW